MKIHCCQCQRKVRARLTNGAEIYPRSPSLAKLPFWACPDCGNYVGCHHKNGSGLVPLGYIATPELRSARQHIHALIDPVWKSGRMTRRAIYKAISEAIGREFHTAKIRSVEDAREVYRVAKRVIQTIV
jgi:hypothetical protein